MKKLVFVFVLLALITTAGQAAQVAKWSFENNLNDTASGGSVSDILYGQSLYPGNGVSNYSTCLRDPIYVSVGVVGGAVRIGALTADTAGAMYLVSADGNSADLDLAGGTYTMEAFIKADTLETTYTRIFSKWVSGFSPYAFHYTIKNSSGYKLDIIHNKSSNSTVTTTGTTILSAAQWYHIAITAGSSTITLWVNGVSCGTVAYDNTICNSNSPFWVGGRTDVVPASNNSALKGLVDEAIIWNEVKDAAYMASRAALAATANANDAKAYSPAPASGATAITPEGTTMSWSSNATSPTYKVYFGTDVNSLTTKVYEGTTTSYATGVLAQNTKYYWRVDVVVGTTTYTGDVWNFTTSNAILTNLPVTNAKSQNPGGITLSWTSIGTSPTYDVYFGTDPNALSLVSNDQAGTSYDTGALSAVMAYYWRIDVTSGSNSFTGAVLKFTSGGKVTASYPGNGGFNVDNNAIFIWAGEAEIATAYNVYLGSSQSVVAAATTASPEYMGQFTDQSWQVTSTMSYNTMYYWRVDEIINGTAITGDVKGFLVRTIPEVKLYWPLDGSAADSTANGNNGVVYGGGVSWETGLLGQCANIQTAFSEISCYGAVNLPYDINDCWSMNMFVNIPTDLGLLSLIGGFGSTANNAQPAAEARYFMYYDIDDQYRPEHDGIPHLYFWTGRGWLDLESSKNYTLNKWNMLTTTYDAYARTTKLYLNGDLMSSRQYYPNLTSVRSSYQDVLLAPTNIWNTNEFTGKIDEFKIYYSTLNGTEVQTLLPWAHNPSPADDSNAITLSPTLTWQGSAAATGYTLKYGTSLDSNGDIISPTIVSGLTVTSYALADLDVNTTYYWTVDSAVTGYGTVPVPEVWNFTTGGNCVGQPESDLNGDCKVDFKDVKAMQDEWLNDGRDDYDVCVNQPVADINGDCIVNFLDYAEMGMEWMDCGFDIPELCQ